MKLKIPLLPSCFICYGGYKPPTNAKRLMTNAKGYFKFERLDVWKDARVFISLVYKITSTFPKEEQFGLINQIRRAAVSIALNIAEGSIKGSDLDLKRFLRISLGSINEVISAFYIALDQEFLDENKFKEIYDSALKLNARLNAFINSISRSSNLSHSSFVVSQS